MNTRWLVLALIGVPILLGIAVWAIVRVEDSTDQVVQNAMLMAFARVERGVLDDLEEEAFANLKACNEECFPLRAVSTTVGCLYQVDDTTWKLCSSDPGVEDDDAESWVEFEATAYVAGPGAICKDGTPALHENDIMAIDPTVLEMGESYKVRFQDGTVRVFTAHDTGGAVKGNIIDILLDDYDRAIRFGRQRVWVTPVEETI
jgi:3D (Asp-Asp-Asp) domain-containing protein